MCRRAVQAPPARQKDDYIRMSNSSACRVRNNCLRAFVVAEGVELSVFV